jgi:hypothetical protein
MKIRNFLITLLIMLLPSVVFSQEFTSQYFSTNDDYKGRYVYSYNNYTNCGMPGDCGSDVIYFNSLEEFRVKHPKLVKQFDKYLGETGRSHFLEPHSSRTWQLFVDQIEPDVEIQEEILNICQLFKDKSWKVRDNAIDKLGEAKYMPQLLVFRRPESFTPEQHRCLDEVIRNWDVMSVYMADKLRNDLGYLQSAMVRADNTLRVHLSMRIAELWVSQSLSKTQETISAIYSK